MPSPRVLLSLDYEPWFALARRYDSWREPQQRRALDGGFTRQALDPILDLLPNGTIDDAYAVQQRVVETTKAGVRLVGRKIGLTSPAVQRVILTTLRGELVDLGFTTEAFCALTAETALEEGEPATFLKQAVDFANQHLWGTLNACLIVHPQTRAQLGDDLEHALERLRYGTIAINHWPAIGFALGVTTWGAYPGHTRQHISSGIGVVHNTLLFEHPEKSIIDGPFTVCPQPPWFVTYRNAAPVARHLLRLESQRFLPALLPLTLAALRD